MKDCSLQNTKKYITRDSPPYPANECCHQRKIGNDGTMYVSVPSKAGICRWIKVSSVKKSPAKKSSVKKSTVKKSSSKKSPTKKSPVKKSAVKKSPVKKSPSKKSPVKKSASKKKSVRFVHK